jgi:hypothetical protein
MGVTPDDTTAEPDATGDEGFDLSSASPDEPGTTDTAESPAAVPDAASGRADEPQ